MEVTSSFARHTERKVITILQLQTAVQLYISSSLFYDATGSFYSASTTAYDMLFVGDTTFYPATSDYEMASALFVTPYQSQISQTLSASYDDTYTGTSASYSS